MILCSCVPDLIFPRVFWPRVRYGLLFFRHGSVIIWPGQSRQSRHICFSCPPRFRPAAPCCPVSFFLRSVVRRFFSRSSLLSFGSPQIPHAPEFLFFHDRFYFRAPVLILPPSARQAGLLLARSVRQVWALSGSQVPAQLGHRMRITCTRALRLSSKTRPIFRFAQGS
jgi:hypothetical protein